MNNYNTIDNYLFDEENRYTQAEDLWDGYFAEHKDEIDERPWVQVDGLLHRHDLNRQIGDMLQHVLTDEEEELIRLYFGIDRRRHTIEELGILFDNSIHANGASPFCNRKATLFR